MANANSTESVVRTNDPAPAEARITFRPENVFIIAGHGSETRLRVNRDTRHFRTTIARNVSVESEFPRYHVPANIFPTYTAQLGVAQAPYFSLQRSIALVQEGDIPVPLYSTSNGGYASYKDQIYQLGNNTFDKTFRRAAEVDAGEGPNNLFVFGMDLGIYDPEQYDRIRFRSYGPIASDTNIQNVNDTFLFNAPDVSVKIHTTLQGVEKEYIDYEFVEVPTLMASGIIPIEEYATRYPIGDATTTPPTPPSPRNLKTYYFYFIGSILRDYTIGQIEDTIDTILNTIPQEQKNKFRDEKLMEVNSFRERVWDDSLPAFDRIVGSTGNVADADLREFLLHQIQAVRFHWVYGYSLTEEQFRANYFDNIYNTRTTTSALIQKIIERKGQAAPILIVNYHCRSFLVGEENLKEALTSANGSPTFRNLTRQMKTVLQNSSISNQERRSRLQNLIAQRNVLTTKWGRYYQNEFDPERLQSKKITRLEQDPSEERSEENETRSFIRFGRPVISRQLSVGAQPIFRRPTAPSATNASGAGAGSGNATGGRRNRKTKKRNQRRRRTTRKN